MDRKLNKTDKTPSFLDDSYYNNEEPLEAVNVNKSISNRVKDVLSSIVSGDIVNILVDSGKKISSLFNIQGEVRHRQKHQLEFVMPQTLRAEQVAMTEYEASRKITELADNGVTLVKDSVISATKAALIGIAGYIGIEKIISLSDPIGSINQITEKLAEHSDSIIPILKNTANYAQIGFMSIIATLAIAKATTSVLKHIGDKIRENYKHSIFEKGSDFTERYMKNEKNVIKMSALYDNFLSAKLKNNEIGLQEYNELKKIPVESLFAVTTAITGVELYDKSTGKHVDLMSMKVDEFKRLANITPEDDKAMVEMFVNSTVNAKTYYRYQFEKFMSKTPFADKIDMSATRYIENLREEYYESLLKNNAPLVAKIISDAQPERFGIKTPVADANSDNVVVFEKEKYSISPEQTINDEGKAFSGADLIASKQDFNIAFDILAKTIEEDQLNKDKLKEGEKTLLERLQNSNVIENVNNVEDISIRDTALRALGAFIERVVPERVVSYFNERAREADPGFAIKREAISMDEIGKQVALSDPSTFDYGVKWFWDKDTELREDVHVLAESMKSLEENKKSNSHLNLNM